MVTQEQLKNLSDRVSKLQGYLEIEKKLIEISNEEENLALNDSLSNRIISFSMITIVAMVILGVLETLYIRNYLKRRKVI